MNHEGQDESKASSTVGLYGANRDVMIDTQLEG